MSEDFGIAFAKAQAAAGFDDPHAGHRLRQRERQRQAGRAAAGAGAARDGLPHPGHPRHRGLPERQRRGGGDGLQGATRAGPTCVDLIKSNQIDIIFNTPLGRESFYDDGAIRKSATLHGVLIVTTLTAAAATVKAIRGPARARAGRVSLQEIHAGADAAPVGGPRSSVMSKPLYLALSGGGGHAAAHAGVCDALATGAGARRGHRRRQRAARWWPRPGPAAPTSTSWWTQAVAAAPVDVGARLGRRAALRHAARRC